MFIKYFLTRLRTRQGSVSNVTVVMLHYVYSVLFDASQNKTGFSFQCHSSSNGCQAGTHHSSSNGCQAGTHSSSNGCQAVTVVVMDVRLALTVVVMDVRLAQ